MVVRAGWKIYFLYEIIGKKLFIVPTRQEWGDLSFPDIIISHVWVFSVDVEPVTDLLQLILLLGYGIFGVNLSMSQDYWEYFFEIGFQLSTDYQDLQALKIFLDGIVN